MRRPRWWKNKPGWYLTAPNYPWLKNGTFPGWAFDRPVQGQPVALLFKSLAEYESGDFTQAVLLPLEWLEEVEAPS